MEKLVDYYTAVLERGEVLPSKNHIADDAQQPTIPAEVYAVVLAGKAASLRRIDLHSKSIPSEQIGPYGWQK